MESAQSKRDRHALKHDHRHFLRILILDPWFRAALVLVILAFCTALISLPKIWRTTPPMFRPQVRVSLLNLAQAWQLRRSARAMEAQGQDVEAIQNWYQAFTKNAADLDTVRNALRSVIERTNAPPSLVDRVASLPGWLLRLSATNQSDLVLAARYLDRAGSPEGVYALLEPLKDQLSPQSEVIYLKALIERRDQQQYEARWQRVESELKNDPEFALYHQGYLATWGPLAGRAEARARLAAAADDPAWQTLARRLQLMHWAEARDVDGFAVVFGRLTDARLDRVLDHIQYWGLLLAAGRREEARLLAQQYTLISRNPRDVVALAEAFEALEMTEQAKRLLRTTTLNYGGSGSPAANAIWLSRANVLVRASDWQGLLDLVEQVRSFPPAVEQLGGWVDAVEGRAQHGLQRPVRAHEAFTAASQKRFWTPQLELDVAMLAKQLGYFQPALVMLLAVEKDFRDLPAYWESVFVLADALKQDGMLLLKAATEVRRLAPDNPSVKFNYAAALLVNRLDPAQAVLLTREFLTANATSAEVMVNHGLALALNQRYDEAEALLKAVDPGRFDEFGKSVYHLCSFEVALGRNDLVRAREHATQIQARHLFPNQAQWLERMRRERLEPPAEKTGG